jgi:hypothetical protein
MLFRKLKRIVQLGFSSMSTTGHGRFMVKNGQISMTVLLGLAERRPENYLDLIDSVVIGTPFPEPRRELLR